MQIWRDLPANIFIHFLITRRLPAAHAALLPASRRVFVCLFVFGISVTTVGTSTILRVHADEGGNI